ILLLVTMLLLPLLEILAQPVVYSEDTLVVPKENEQVTLKKTIRRQFDRGIEKFTFVPKGQWFTGASFSYTEFFNEDYKLLILDNWSGQGYTMSVRPTIGYMVANNIGIGVSLTYDRTFFQLDNIDISLGDDLNFSIEDYYMVKHIYTGSVFLRTFINIGNSRRFALYNDLCLQAGGGQAKMLSGKGDAQTGTYQDIFEFGVVSSPGVTVFINNFTAAQVSVGLLGFKYKNIKQISNQVEEGEWRQSSANFKINILALNLGLVFYL
ncbi:MAG: hypothetical protein PHD21_08835, partial [Flavobacteriales bacterium]|nr:hypothetical protein [Flavobacteriales bacterium]